ncbi:hypothetical protein MMC07_001692, partial [Pseudocyphellaria aurata]|nr:hypothetical protein [Pseudocyphellaria aurata]
MKNKERRSEVEEGSPKTGDRRSGTGETEGRTEEAGEAREAGELGDDEGGRLAPGSGAKAAEKVLEKAHGALS